MRLELPCPKCGAKTTRIEEVDRELVQRCTCGLTAWLERSLANGTVAHRAVTRLADTTLPRKASKLYRCLLAVSESYPESTTTALVCKFTGFHMKEVSSMMLALMGRGLITRLEIRRGLVGGSVWALTVRAKSLLNL